MCISILAYRVAIAVLFAAVTGFKLESINYDGWPVYRIGPTTLAALADEGSDTEDGRHVARGKGWDLYRVGLWEGQRTTTWYDAIEDLSDLTNNPNTDSPTRSMYTYEYRLILAHVAETGDAPKVGWVQCMASGPLSRDEVYSLWNSAWSAGHIRRSMTKGRTYELTPLGVVARG